jgi:signal transduction histidine kinase/ligand-binding sensor domain-containing protein
VIVAATLVVESLPALALNPALDLSQYAHKAWTVREGFAKSVVNSVAQTPDGYLWLGSEFGLLRFDGVRSVPWQPPSGQSLPSNDVESLLVTRDGTLWIGTDKGLAHWTGTTLTAYAELQGRLVLRLLQDHEGTVWAGTLEVGGARLCSIRSASVQCAGGDGRLGDSVSALYEDHLFNLWASVSGGVWRWKPGTPQFFSTGTTSGLQSFAEIDDGLVIGTSDGVRRIGGGTLGANLLPANVGAFHASRLLRDRDGGLWLGTHDRGLLHLHDGRVDSFSRADGLSGDNVWNLLEDREGNVWVTTSDGFDRFHDLAVAPITVKQGLSSHAVSSVLATRDGAVWLATDLGLNRWSHGSIAATGRPAALTSSAMFQDQAGRLWLSNGGLVGYLDHDRFVFHALPGRTRAFAEPSTTEIWAANQRGLVQLTTAGVGRQILWTSIGHHDFASALVADQRGVWAGFLEGGLVYIADAVTRASFSSKDGLGGGRVNDLLLQGNGILWASTAGGLSRVKEGRVKTLTRLNGLPCDSVQWAMPDDTQFWWLYMPCGLVRIPTMEMNAWAAAPAQGGEPYRLNHTRVFDAADGVPLQGYPLSISPAVAKAADGTLWFTSFHGLSRLDPRRLPFNTEAPPVHIERVVADRHSYESAIGLTGDLRLPPLVRDLEIDYTALSLTAPEKVQFRYLLEGRDADWQQAGVRRQAIYSDLRPGHYRFRVTAANNDGVWNDQGAVAEFTVTPAWFQTATFRVLLIGLVACVGWTLYVLRVRQIARAMNARFDERLAERTRVARDLHDTLVQTVQGSKLVADHALKNVNDHSALAQAMGQIAEWLARANEEGRAALQSLRTSTTLTNDLAQALKRALDECHVESGIETSFSSIGSARELHPVVRDEIYRIGYEAIRNACKHSNGRHVEVILEYARDLRLGISDDGTGIDPETVSSGKEGHFGLNGMRERASRINARLTVENASPSGTAINLVVPGRIAFTNR